MVLKTSNLWINLVVTAGDIPAAKAPSSRLSRHLQSGVYLGHVDLLSISEDTILTITIGTEYGLP
jgi:hypothetical protein